MAVHASGRYCDFCGKNQHEVEALIAGPIVFICDECIVAAQIKLDEVRAERMTARTTQGES